MSENNGDKLFESLVQSRQIRNENTTQKKRIAILSEAIEKAMFHSGRTGNAIEKEKGNIEFKQSPNGVLINADGGTSKWNVYTKIWLNDRQEEGQTPVDIITKFENRHSAKELIPLSINS